MRQIASLGDDGLLEFNPIEILRDYERKYFPDVEPISSVEVLENTDDPASFIPSQNLIRMSRVYTPFYKIIAVMLLHELIHSKLYKENGDPDKNEGERFQCEIDRLWVQGAYRKLL
jgi:hypothetical protein